jgi:hypothetical protein
MSNFKDNSVMLESRVLITKITGKIASFLVIFLLLGCAVGNPFPEAKDEIPSLKPNMARIFVYRSFNPLALLRPLVFKLNGQNIADTYASTIFYHDVNPGKHLLNMGSRKEDVKLDLAEGETVYVRYSIADDTVSKANYIAEVIKPKVAVAELSNVRLIKKELRYPGENK